MSDRIDIGHLARLSRLGLTPEEEKKYATQMGGVLEYAEKIADFRVPEPFDSTQDKFRCGTEKIQTSFATSGESAATPEESPVSPEVGIINGVTDAMREDEVTESLPRAEALKNAPAQKDGFIQVKAVFAESE